MGSRSRSLLTAVAAGVVVHVAGEVARLVSLRQGWGLAELAPSLGLEAALAAAALGLALGLFARRGATARVTVGASVGIAGAWAVVAALVEPAAGDGPTAPGSGGSGRTVVLVTADTLRRDHVSAYPDALVPGATPALEALAGEGTLFVDAITTAPLTLPSHATLLTGEHPLRHGVVRNGRPLPADLVGVPQRFAEAGFHVGGFPGSAILHGAHGLSRWFHVYRDELGPWPGARRMSLLGAALRVGSAVRGESVGVWDDERGDRTVARALQWVRSRPQGADVFVWVHLYDPHTPRTQHAEPHVGDARASLPHPCDYSAHPSAMRRSARDPVRPDRPPLAEEAACRALDWSERDRDVARYADEVRFLDAQVGALVDGLAALGRWDDAGLVFVADHGESLVEHQQHATHQYDLYDPVLRVPLVVRAPACGDCPASVTTPTSTARVAATLRWLGGLGPDPAIEGPHLLEPWAGVPVAVGPAPVDLGAAGASAVQVAAVAGGWKVIRDGTGHVERYDTRADPRELRSRVTAEERAAAASAVQAWLAPRSHAPGAVRSPLFAGRPPSEATRASLLQPGVLGEVVALEDLAPSRPAEEAARAALSSWRPPDPRAEASAFPEELRRSLEALGYAH